MATSKTLTPARLGEILAAVNDSDDGAVFIPLGSGSRYTALSVAELRELVEGALTRVPVVDDACAAVAAVARILDGGQEDEVEGAPV